MNIPLNIDWQQILLHLFNFVILAVGLYILLYKPVRDFMDKRRAYYEELDTRANDRFKAAEELQNEYDGKMTLIESEIEAKRADSVKEMTLYRESEIKRAEKESEAILNEARLRAEEECSRLIEEARGEIADSVIATAEKLIRRSIDEDCTDLLDDMIRRVGDNCG